MNLILAVSTHPSFTERLSAHPYRAGVSLLVLLIVGGIMFHAVNKLLGIIAGLGAGWVTWQIPNLWSHNPIPFIYGEPTLSSIFKFFVGSPLQIIVAFGAAGIGLLVWWLGQKNKQTDRSPVFVRALAAVGAFVGIIVAFNLVYAVILHFHG